MVVEYFFQDDSRLKEGDLAREGFVHIIYVRGTSEECKSVQKWCGENFEPANIKTYFHINSFHYPYTENMAKYLTTVFLRDPTDVFLLRLTWP